MFKSVRTDSDLGNCQRESGIGSLVEEGSLAVGTVRDDSVMITRRTMWLAPTIGSSTARSRPRSWPH